MALSVKDGNGTLTSLKTTLTGSDHMPHHIIQEISGSNVTTIISKLTDISSSAAAVQTVTASLTNPVYITGSVSVIQPVVVDVTASDFITASISNAYLTVTSSLINPVFITGTVDASGSLLTEIKNSVSPLSSAFVTYNDSKFLKVTSSQSSPVYVSSSTDSPVLISGSVGASILNSYIYVTSSNASPIVNTPRKSSNTTTTKLVHNQYTVGENYIDYTSSFSGTFIISNHNVNRSTLIVFNPSPYNLYVSVGSGSDGPNGFMMNNTASAPLKYSFILFPSGTYIADDSTVSAFHAGFFISSSESGFSPETFSTQVSY